MPNRHSTLNSLFTDIANAIRTKKGEASSVKYVADNFDTAIASIQVAKPEETFTATPKTTSQTITPTTGSVFSSGTVNPIYEEISSSATMDSNKVAANEGKMYKFTGTTDSTYTKNRYYILKEYENPVPITGGLSVSQFMNITQNNDTLEVQ